MNVLNEPVTATTEPTRRILSTGGYVLIRAVGHPRATKKGHYVFEHIAVMERTLGRLLKPGEVVHHINHDKIDNRPENLRLMAAGEHNRSHSAIYLKPFQKGISWTPEQIHRISTKKKMWWAKKKSSPS